MQSHNHFSLAKTNSFCLIAAKRDVNIAKIFLRKSMVLYFVVPFGDISTRLPCYWKDSKQGCESMTDCSVLNNVTVDIDSIYGVHVGNAFRSVFSDIPIPCLSKIQDRSQLVQKSHHHIQLHVTFTFPFHHRSSIFVLDGHGGTLRLRIVSEIKDEVDWFRQNSFADQCFVSSLKLSFHLVKHLKHNVLWMLVMTCWKHCYKFQSTALVENVTLVGVNVVPTVGTQNLG